MLKSQIAKTRGDLGAQNLLGELAQQFGTAIGNYGALRDAIGYYDKEEKQWKYKQPSGEEYRTVTEPHARGAILVAAVFEAFLTIYKSRVADLLRIATGGTGILPQGELHPDLVNRLAADAAKSSGHVLKMCIRALDYCPPVDITFGDYLRAIITADADLVEDDNRDYRIAFIDAFRKRGIYPTGIKNLSVESLCYPNPDVSGMGQLLGVLVTFLRKYRDAIFYIKDREQLFHITRKYITGGDNVHGLHRRIDVKFDGNKSFQQITGLMFSTNYPGLGIPTSTAYGQVGPSFSVHSLHVASRASAEGRQSNQIIITLTQSALIEFYTGDDGLLQTRGISEEFQLEGGLKLSGGCTLIFDLDTLELKYAISKPLLDMDFMEPGQEGVCIGRASTLNAYINGTGSDTVYTAYFHAHKGHDHHEPFAFLHNH